MDTRDLELERRCPSLKQSSYKITSPNDPRYNCVAYAVGDLTQFWYDLNVKGYYWPPGAGSADTIQGWIRVFEIHGYRETEDRTLEPEYEKVAIYASADGPEHVARQKASGMWTSKAGKGIDLEHTLEALEGAFYGKVERVMKRKCKDGRRVLE
ncbi:MAG: hypothetical protein WCD57_08810 [Acidobacteriaceae bacterium]